MYQMLRLIIAVMGVALVSLPTQALAQVATTQVQLTESQIQGFIAAQKEVSATVQKMQDAVSTDQVNTKYAAELEKVAKKYGFKNFVEYETITANISLVISAIDPQTKEFNDAQTAIKQELESVRADRTIPASQKKQLLAELNEALKSAPSIQFPTNIDLVKKYYDKIDVTTIDANDGEHPISTAVRTISE
jgi:hypothetical protein